MKFTKKIYVLIILLASVFGFSRLVFAAETDFKNDVKVIYEISPTGITNVTYYINLINNTSLSYPSQYLVSIDSTDVFDPIAYDIKGKIIPQTKKSNNHTDIIIIFNEHSIGKGSQLSFSLRYKTGSIVKKSGSVWELYIPKISDDSQNIGYTIEVNIPDEFGIPAYLYPTPASGRSWTKEQLVLSPVYGAFGQKQIYKTAMIYHLINNKPNVEIIDIVIPSDTAFQKTTIQLINPLPIHITQDSYGNWLAGFRLLPFESIDIYAEFLVELFIRPRSNIIQEDLINNPPGVYHSQTDQTNILSSESFKSIDTPEKIYNYVQNKLSYDYTLLRQTHVRRNISEILTDPKRSLAQDFTELFIQLANLHGISSRQIIGIAVSGNQITQPVGWQNRLLHTWPEYYDEKRLIWVPVDPTWANTGGGRDYFNQLDFKHITLSIAKDAYAKPLYTNRLVNNYLNDNEITIEALDQLPPTKSGRLTGSLQFPGFVLSGVKTHGLILLENTTDLNIDQIQLSLKVYPEEYSLKLNEDNLPPYSDRHITFMYPNKDLYTLGRGKITLNINSETIEKKFFYIPVIPIIALPLVLFIILKIVFLLFKMKKNE